MVCWKCGQEISDDTKICPNCGTKTQKYYETSIKEIKNQEKEKKEKYDETKNKIKMVNIKKVEASITRNNFGIASLILSLFSFFVSLYFVVPVTSLILGIIGVANIDRYSSLNKLAIAGLLLSIASMIMWIVLIAQGISALGMFF